MKQESSKIERCFRLTMNPIKMLINKRFNRVSYRFLETQAYHSWDISPGNTLKSKAAYYLPNQLERVSGWAFMDEHPRREMEGGLIYSNQPTRGYLLKNVTLADGSLYKNDAVCVLNDRAKHLPTLHIKHELDHAAIYSTYNGNRYFGSWLIDDCVTYPLANTFGMPVTLEKKRSAHALDYKARFGMSATPLENAFFKELVMFDDIGQNASKHNRFKALGEKLRQNVEVKPHPGVFLMRGQYGALRYLTNELELAEHLKEKHGFRILDPMKESLSTIVSVCAGAQVVMGVEGSQLIHGMLLLAQAGTLFTIQPPDRFVSVLKHLTDRDGQNFAFVVGIPEGNGFRVIPEEIDRTLELLP